MGEMQQNNNKNRSDILLFDASSGISGDMAAAALLDLCEDREFIQTVMAPFESLGYFYLCETVEKSGKTCLNTWVKRSEGILEEDHHTWKEILDVIGTADLSEGARALAVSIYERIAAAETSVHNTAREQLHFHEVGSMASILNVIAFAAAYDHLGITHAYVPCLYEGTGTIQCAHGTMQVPVPAVRALLEESYIPLFIKEEAHGEIMTPTGCACVLSAANELKMPEVYKVIKTGYGAGKRNTGLAGYLKVSLAEIKKD